MLVRAGLLGVFLGAIAWHQELSWSDVTSLFSSAPEEAKGHQVGRKDDLKAPLQLLSAEELGRHDGSKGSPGLYVALLGRVFDVGRKADVYGPGGGYAFFSGRDASRAFVTGEFEGAGLTDDVAGLTPRQMLELETWLEFYQREYTPVGELHPPSKVPPPLLELHD